MLFPVSWTNQPALPSAHFRSLALQRQSELLKPAASLGRLEAIAVQLAGMQSTEQPMADQIHISIFAGDHGVCAESISAYPQTVTAQMIANFANGGAAISVLAKFLGATLEVINLGTVTETADLPGVINARIAPCTRNFVHADAMTSQQVTKALLFGDEAAARAARAGCHLFIGGDMGIGNTTAAAAIACAMLNKNPMSLAGPGTGLNPAGVRHKAEVIIQALQRHNDDQSPMAVLKAFGGFEIAALAGAIAGCAARGIAVLVDGFIVSVAALIAVSAQPDIRAWLLFGHRSAEPGHQVVLDALEASPLLNMEMHLGEGSGAAVAVPLIRAACALHNNMASFDSAGVNNREDDLPQSGANSRND